MKESRLEQQVSSLTVGIYSLKKYLVFHRRHRKAGLSPQTNEAFLCLWHILLNEESLWMAALWDHIAELGDVSVVIACVLFEPKLTYHTHKTPKWALRLLFPMLFVSASHCNDGLHFHIPRTHGRSGTANRTMHHCTPHYLGKWENEHLVCQGKLQARECTITSLWGLLSGLIHNPHHVYVVKCCQCWGKPTVVNFKWNTLE